MGMEWDFWVLDLRGVVPPSLGRPARGRACERSRAPVYAHPQFVWQPPFLPERTLWVNDVISSQSISPQVFFFWPVF